MGGGGAGEVQKKIFAQGKIKWKKIHARQLTLKNSYKEFDNEKKFLRLKNSPPSPFTTISNDAQQMDQKTNVMATNGARASFYLFSKNNDCYSGDR